MGLNNEQSARTRKWGNIRRATSSRNSISPTSTCQAQCKVIAHILQQNFRHSGHDTSTFSPLPAPPTRWPLPARPQFEPQNTAPFQLALNIQGWPSRGPRQLIHLLHLARTRGTTQTNHSSTMSRRSFPSPALAYQRGLRPPHHGIATARSGPPGRIGSVLVHLQALPSFFLSFCLLPATSAVAIPCLAMPFHSIPSPGRPASTHACVMCPWGCQITLQTDPLATCCLHLPPQPDLRDT